MQCFFAAANAYINTHWIHCNASSQFHPYSQQHTCPFCYPIPSPNKNSNTST